MKPSIYIETTIPSYLTARPSTDVVVLGHQFLTAEWWEKRRDSYDLYTSEQVLEEVLDGDPVAAQRRIEVLDGIPVLAITDEIVSVGDLYVQELGFPSRASTDGIHLACASVYKVDYLLTWNCRHLAHGSVRQRLPGINERLGFGRADCMYTRGIVI